ncbi:hypothetical protein CDD80_2408 [Ophiocordyceps camponoti-rufipedis]|uniref:Uncharacterized protein n=1 Tax=Ophiocordyceps camponoti-rufipedis TaxID=2004952 RepID=A0A2C5Z8A2_9HYPO|nr:hypothetical protein CDD80_2408 [Ophiocordyceps camponoti-rufipedis]
MKYNGVSGNSRRRHAEKAGLGEKHVNHLGQEQMDQTPADLKVPLDRWSLPLVPWIGHPLRASFSKDQGCSGRHSQALGTELRPYQNSHCPYASIDERRQTGQL